MIDIHMIDSGRWAKNLQLQVERVKNPLVSLHITQPVWGNVLQARYDAYLQGSNPYVTWIDDDDEVLDVTWLSQAVDALEADKHLAAIYPRWVAYDGNTVRATSPAIPWEINLVRRSPPVAHHLTIMRRTHVLAVLKQALDGVGLLVQQTENLITASMVRYGRLQLQPTIAYRWNLFPGTARTMSDLPDARRWVINAREEAIAAYTNIPFSRTRNIEIR